MAEYIKREAVKKYPIRLNHYDKKNGNLDFVLGIESVLEYVDDIPAADVVEVCRCGQCRHATDDIIVDGVCYCYKIQQGMFVDGFCSYGERKCEDG